MPKRPRLDAETRQRILNLYQEGELTISQIAREVDRSSSTIYYVLGEAGVPASRLGKRQTEPEEDRLRWALSHIAELEGQLIEAQQALTKERETLRALVRLLEGQEGSARQALSQ